MNKNLPILTYGQVMSHLRLIMRISCYIYYSTSLINLI